ncbi:putative sulfate transporter [compost metagenome]
MPFVLPRLPLLANLNGYRIGWLRNDISAGLAIAAVGLPSAIAYPAIAGLPAETGLYASITPLIAYALFGPSRQLIVGPDAATMTVLAAVLTTVFATSGATVDRVTAAALLALIVGILCLIARLVRLGVLATFLSRPILTGFFAGISLSILVGQIKRWRRLNGLVGIDLVFGLS